MIINSSESEGNNLNALSVYRQEAKGLVVPCLEKVMEFLGSTLGTENVETWTSDLSNFNFSSNFLQSY